MNMQIAHQSVTEGAGLVHAVVVGDDAGGMLTGTQIRQALAALRWSEDDLADAAKVHRNTVNGLTKLNGLPARAEVGTLVAIKRVLEAAGCVFVDDGEASPGGGPGVRVRSDAQIKERVPRGKPVRLAAPAAPAIPIPQGTPTHGPFAAKLPSGRWVAMLDGIHLEGSYPSQAKALAAAVRANEEVDDDQLPPGGPGVRMKKEAGNE